MKKLMKILAKIVLVILIIGIIAFLFINFRGIPTYDTDKIDYTHIATPESLERGKKLALMLCANCHKDPNSGKLTGTKMLDAPPEFGEIFSANITQDKTYGIGEWTDGEIVRLLRTGIKRDGKYAPPYMAKLPTMADEDINALVSFLRSEDPLVTADATPDKPTKPSFLNKNVMQYCLETIPYANRTHKVT